MFSICIPNYNYEQFLGRTLQSILNQTHQEYEVLFSDNHSTDQSVSVAKSFSDLIPGKMKIKVNDSNLGFAGNLDQAGAMASQPIMIMLSSDDLMKKDALADYETILSLLGNDRRVVISSSIEVINADDQVTSALHSKDMRFVAWNELTPDAALSTAIGANVYRADPTTVLRQSLMTASNPFNFLATAYSRKLYLDAGGYGGGRLINPDKWFHWKIISLADEVIFIDKPLFQYRWHSQNLTFQQSNMGHLKFLVDEYRNTIEITNEMLLQAGMTLKEFQKVFIKQDIYRHGIGEFTKGNWTKSLRIYLFGFSTYPGQMVTAPLFLPFTILLLTTPLGSWIASGLRKILK